MTDRDRILLHLDTFGPVHVSAMYKVMREYMPPLRYWSLLSILETGGVIGLNRNTKGGLQWAMPLGAY